jgi:hypothetical protein
MLKTLRRLLSKALFASARLVRGVPEAVAPSLRADREEEEEEEEDH